MCVKSRVGYLPREAGTIGHNFSFKKTELILKPVIALISQAWFGAVYDDGNNEKWRPCHSKQDHQRLMLDPILLIV